MPKPSPIDGTTTTAALLDRSLDRRDVAEEADRVEHAELARERLQRRLERTAAGDLELEVGQLALRLGERAQQHDVPLDRDQSPDAEQARHAVRVRLRLAVRIDPVVDDLEAVVVEALDVLEVAREPARDRDVHVREACERAVGEAEVRRFAKLVEAVLRREAKRHARDRPGEQPVGVGVHEVRVQDRGARAHEVRGHPHERDRVEVGAERDRVERHAARAERAGEVPGAGLVLVQHQHPHVPAALAQARQQREQVRLRAGDAGDLLQMEDRVALSSALNRSEERVGPVLDRVVGGDELAQLGPPAPVERAETRPRGSRGRRARSAARRAAGRRTRDSRRAPGRHDAAAS